MIYQWKIPKFKIDAQLAGAELERISKIGLTAENIVNESRGEEAVLHECFDWNDETAAESYRQTQARDLIRNIVTVDVGDEPMSEPIRAFVSIQNDYKPIDLVINTRDYSDELLAKAFSELLNFRKKYYLLSQLTGLIQKIDETLQEEMTM